MISEEFYDRRVLANGWIPNTAVNVGTEYAGISTGSQSDWQRQRSEDMTHQYWNSSSRVDVQQASQFEDIETHDELSINLSDRGRHIAKLFQFSEGPFIGGDVSIHKFDLVLGKELLHLAAKHSARLAEQHHFFEHGAPLLMTQRGFFRSDSNPGLLTFRLEIFHC